MITIHFTSAFPCDLINHSALCVSSLLKNKKKQTFLFLGAGEAAIGIADLIAYAVAREMGVSVEEARKKIWLFECVLVVTKLRASWNVAMEDHVYAQSSTFFGRLNKHPPSFSSKGLIVHGRAAVTPHKAKFAHPGGTSCFRFDSSQQSMCD